jgi:hypothetical protein
MRAYVATTAVLFGLLTLVHVWRLYEEGSAVMRDPFFLTVTGVAAGMCFWAWRVLRLPRGS